MGWEITESLIEFEGVTFGHALSHWIGCFSMSAAMDDDDDDGDVVRG